MLMCLNAHFDPYSRNGPPHASRLSLGRLSGVCGFVGRSLRHAVYRREAYYSAESGSTRLLRYAGHWWLLGFGYWVLQEKATGAFVGELGFAQWKRELEPAIQVPEAGWVLATAAHGKGYATEALKTARLGCASLSDASDRLPDPPGESGVHPRGLEMRLSRDGARGLSGTADDPIREVTNHFASRQLSPTPTSTTSGTARS